ncbi:MAG TPA: hypothetical protein PL087_00665 [Bacteroidales bacterium]|jgi:uncharacterized protein (DUF2249 family)|nr:hypothetical protein [Bacteroidales bacterium]
MKKDYRELIIAGPKELSGIERFVEEICDYYNVNNEYFGNILLATMEAAEILYSLIDNKIGEGLKVTFDHTPKGLLFKLKILREEENFPEDELDKAIRKHKLSKDIYIIKALADEVTISVNARSIILIFYVTSMNYEKSLERINQLKAYWSKTIKVPTGKNEG